MKLLPLMLTLAIALSGCMTIQDSVPPQRVAGAPATIAFSAAQPGADILPEQSVIAPGTRYVFVQASGSSVFLGPILGSLNVAANTRAMAETYKESVIGIDPTPVALDALEKAGIKGATATSGFVVKPFVFVQHCYDDKFRLSLVFHVESKSASSQWIGRYLYHLPTAYGASQFGALTHEQKTGYRAELAAGAAVLSSLMQRDIAGELPATGKPVNFGSLYLIGNKVGGAGVYTMPEERFFPNSQLIEETDNYVTVRVKSNLRAPGVLGGMAFGVHRIDKALIHTLKPAKTT